jgi:hypothetical protein
MGQSETSDAWRIVIEAADEPPLTSEQAMLLAAPWIWAANGLGELRFKVSVERLPESPSRGQSAR